LNACHRTPQATSAEVQSLLVGFGVGVLTQKYKAFTDLGMFTSTVNNAGPESMLVVRHLRLSPVIENCAGLVGLQLPCIALRYFKAKVLNSSF
jgi:hypothetical protein